MHTRTNQVYINEYRDGDKQTTTQKVDAKVVMNKDIASHITNKPSLVSINISRTNTGVRSVNVTPRGVHIPVTIIIRI